MSTINNSINNHAYAFDTTAGLTAGNTFTVSAGTITLTPLSWGTLCCNATGVVSSQTPGAAGTVLTSNGATALPTWQVVTGGLTWSEETGDKTIVVGEGYIANKAGTALAFALPATSAVGTVFQIAGKGATGWTITQAANQYIRLGNVVTTTGVAGSVTNTNQYDSISLVCIEADLGWSIQASVGNLTLA